MKPRIRIYRSDMEFIKWICDDGDGDRLPGFGRTPQEAYECWINQEMPF